MPRIPDTLQTEFKTASFDKIFKGFVVDIFFLIFSFVFPFVLASFLSDSGVLKGNSLGIMFLAILGCFNLLLLPLFYYMYVYPVHQASLGLKLMGVKVLSAEGKNLTPIQACQMFLSSLYFWIAPFGKRPTSTLRMSCLMDNHNYIFIERK